MEELWRKLTELMTQRPTVWLPVLLADLLAFLIGLGSRTWIQAILRKRLEPHSVLGGAAVVSPLNPAAVQHAIEAVTPIEWAANLLRLLLYTLAFLATVALVRAFRARSEHPWGEVGAVLRRQFLDVLPVAGTALLVYLVTAAASKFLSDFLLRHGHKEWLRGGAAVGGWFGLVTATLSVALLAFFVAPAAVQALAQQALEPLHRQQAQILSFSLGIVALLLGRFVESNLLALHQPSVWARSLLGMTGSWIAALPYAMLFAGLGLLAMRAGWGTDLHRNRQS